MSRLKSLGLAVVLLVLTYSLTTAAVDLNYFIVVEWTASGVELEFETGSEIDHIAFNIYRSTTNVSISPTGQADLSGMTKLNSSPIRNPDGSCLITGYTYTFVDSNVPSTPNTFYYYLQSLPCEQGSSPYVYGDGSNGLPATRPGTTPPPTSVPATSTPPPASTTAPQPTSTPQPTNPPAATSTPQPTTTTAPGQPTSTPQPTTTLPLPVTVTPRPGQPTATTAPGQPTPRPGQPTATTAPGQPTPRPGQPTATTAPGQPTPRPGQPTTPPAPGQPTPRPGQPPATTAPSQPTTPPAPGQPTPRPGQPPATTAPGQPTSVAGVPPAYPGQPQPTFALPPAAGSGSDPLATLPPTASTPAAESTVVTVDPATGEIALATGTDGELQPGTTTLNGSITLVTPSPVAISPTLEEPPATNPSLVAGQQQGDPLDWLIQGIIGLIIIAIIGIGGLLALTYARNR